MGTKIVIESINSSQKLQRNARETTYSDFHFLVLFGDCEQVYWISSQ